MDSQVIIDGTILVGSSIGATAAALTPYWQKIREQQALGQPIPKFDKKFLGTLIIAFVIGIATALMSFDTTAASIDQQHSTIVKIFIVAIVTSATSNITLNRFLAISPLVDQVNSLKKENASLVDQNNKLATIASTTVSTTK